MKRFVFAFGLAVMIGGAAYGQQQQPAKPAPTKIGIIDIVRALSETAEGQKEFAGVQEWADKQNEGLRKMESEYNILRERYMQEQLKVSAQARADMERQLQDSETRLRRRQEDLNEELGQRRQSILNRLGGKMQQIVQEYAEQNNYLAILVAQQGMFAYVASAGDLSEQIRKLYDNRYPVKAPPASKPAFR